MNDGIAYIILAHKNPHQLARLVSRLSNAKTKFYIHIDKNVDRKPFVRAITLLKCSNIKYVKRVRSYWPTHGITKAFINGLYALRKDGFKYHHAVFLSGQCYPIKPINDIHRFLEENRGKCFIHLHPDLREEDCRYHFRLLGRSIHFPYKQNENPLNKSGKIAYIFYLISRIVYPFIKPRKFGLIIKNGIQRYWGHNWCTLTPEAVEIVLEQYKKNKNLNKYYKWHLGSDEEYFHTILFNSHIKDKIVKRSITWQHWVRLKEWPYIFTMNISILSRV